MNPSLNTVVVDYRTSDILLQRIPTFFLERLDLFVTPLIDVLHWTVRSTVRGQPHMFGCGRIYHIQNGLDTGTSSKIILIPN